jgi:hypothetical protein
MVAIGGALFFIPFHNEPFWTEWMLGPILFYLGGPVAIVRAAIHFFGGPANNCGFQEGADCSEAAPLTAPHVQSGFWYRLSRVVELPRYSQAGWHKLKQRCALKAGYL